MGRFISSTTGLTPAQRKIVQIAGAFCCQWTVPSGVTTATFEIWGGGGAGGPKCCCYCGASMGGAAGGYSIKTITVSAGSQYTLCAGGGGAVRYCSVSGTNQGCSGDTSYVTGTGLTNFCATGGLGGYTVCCQQLPNCCGGVGYGGDVNIIGGDGWQMGGCSWNYCHMSAGGSAAFSGKVTHTPQQCCMYGNEGRNGIFPGGGGTGFYACACDCCACNGAGGAGLVKVTY